jgi:hypothetical protein
MTLAVRSSESTELVAVDGWEQTRKALVRNPLRAAPQGLQQPIWRLWACHRHLTGLESPLSLAAMFGVWCREYGLTEDDAAAILAGCLSPERMGQFKFASDLITHLAGAAAVAIRRRKVEAEQAARREAGESITAEEQARAAEMLQRWQDQLFSHFNPAGSPDEVPL